ncbi:hypothetical protein AAG906_018258 [Vitis piasezkii]|uniref:Uncharacterized protein n=1 Tax=Vitis vinifera TaxID=29760 RepID=A0A438J383_VITVI|nr:hypothetical protein CK203_019878 [Vitis vinifera]
MGWLFGERRGPGWKDQALASVSPPPMPLLGIFIIVFLLLSLSSYLDYKVQVHRTVISLRLFLFLLPVILFLLARTISVHGKFVIRLPKLGHNSIHRAGSSPWGVAALVVLLLILVSYQSSLQSRWFRPLWTSY